MTANGGPFIAAFDVATATGCADGVAGGRPRFWTWDLHDAGEGRPARLAYLRRFADAYFAEQRIDACYYEAPLPIGVVIAAAARHAAGEKDQLGASDKTLSLLRGAIGVLEASAAVAGVPVIEGVPIHAARGIFCGRSNFPKGEAKKFVQEMCRVLRFEIEDEHQGDAIAVWHWASVRANPRAAALLQPGARFSKGGKR